MALSVSLRLPSIIHLRQTQGRLPSWRFRVYTHLESLKSERRSGHFKPTIWHDDFIQSLNTRDEHEDRNMERVCQLKKEVSQMIYKEEVLRDKLELVDAIQQLGLAYHFKDEISSVLTQIHESMEQLLLQGMLDDIYVVSLLFRLLRMHEFSVSEDIFKAYFDDKGHCKANLNSDIKGILSLYEASFFTKEGEEVLEIARNFTTEHLKNFLECSKYNNSRLKEQVAHALELPLNWRMERQHTRWFINQYKTDEQIRPALWELAVLDFNLIQNSYKKELKHVSRWWTYLRIYEKLPFIRDRLVENYLWSVGWAFEPENASYRIAQTQANCLITTIDDIYDVYGLLNELELFTDAIQQWDISATEALPEYMQMCCLALFETVKGQGHQVWEKKGLNVIPYLRRAWKDLCKAYLVEARWYHNGYAPTLEEYLENAWVSSSGNVILSYAYCFNDYVTAKDLEQFSSGYPDIVQYSLMNLRLYNDLATSSAELKRGDIDKTIQCYMRSKSVTEPVACQEIKELIWKNWTSLNGEIVSDSGFEKYFKNVALNVSRMSQCFYHHEDGYGKPDKDTKDQVYSVLLRPIELN